jgi:hypothetical protein
MPTRRIKTSKRCMSHLTKINKLVSGYKKKEKSYTKKLIKIQKDFMKLHKTFHNKLDNIREINVTNCEEYPEFRSKINNMMEEMMTPQHNLLNQIIIDHHKNN